MIQKDLYVDAAGTRATDVQDRAQVEGLDGATGALGTLEVRRFATASHAGYRLRTLSGAEAVVSNNCLVWPEGAGYILAQAAAGSGYRIRTIVDGDIRWEPVVWGEPEPAMLDVVSLVAPGGLLAVGVAPHTRIFITEPNHAAPYRNS